MRLKLFVSVMIAAAVILLLGWPIWVGPLPHRPAKRAAVRQYSQRALVVIGGVLVLIVCAGTGSYLLIRQAKRDYESGTMTNVQHLVAGAMEDHKKKAEEADEA